MPKLWLAQQPARNCLQEACVRFVRGFSTLAGGQDRLGWLERRSRVEGRRGTSRCDLAGAPRFR